MANENVRRLVAELRELWVRAPDGESADDLIIRALPRLLVAWADPILKTEEHRALIERTLKMGSEPGADPASMLVGMVDALVLYRDARILELLDYNNREVEKRRAAERSLAVANTVIGNLGEALYEAKTDRMGWFLAELMAWQHATFGPNQTLEGIRDHMRRELKEIEDAPHDKTEAIDLINLCISYLRRLGLDAAEVVTLWRQRFDVLKARKWPDWRNADPDKAIEHVREKPQAHQPDIYSRPTTGPETISAPIERGYTESEIETAFRSFAAGHVDRTMEDHGHTVPTTHGEQERQADGWWEQFRSALRARRLTKRRR